MAAVQPSIIDLDDLFIQIDQILGAAGGGTSLTINTVDAHGITDAGNTKVVISGTTNHDGTYDISSITDADTIVLSGTGISQTDEGTLSDGNSVGKALADDLQDNGQYYTPEILIDASGTNPLTITINSAGNLSTAGTGVTGQALYSFLKEVWKMTESITRFKFPMLSITNEQFEFQDGWEPVDDTTRLLIRTAGWAEVDSTLTPSTKRAFSGIVSLGLLGDTETPYYIQKDSFSAPTFNAAFEGEVNQAVLIYGNAISTDYNFATATTITSTAIDFTTYFQIGDEITISGATAGGNNTTHIVTAVATGTLTCGGSSFTTGADSNTVVIAVDRANTFQLFIRTRGRTYADSSIADIGVSEMTYIVYRFPLTNANDLNIKTYSDNALTGVNIASITSDGTKWTVTTSTAHGLYVDAPVRLNGTTGGTYDGDEFIVSSVNGTVETSTEFEITNANNLTDQGSAAGTARLAYVHEIDVEYLPNPDTNTDDVVIKGNYDTGGTVVYTPGDVVLDVGDTTSQGADRWYYLDGLDANVGHTSIQADNAANAGTWARWTPGERNIEKDGTTWSAYTTIFDFNNAGTTPGATKEVGYEYAQYLLRQTTDINAGTNTDRNGNIADPLVFFVGSQLNTYADADIPFAVVVDDIASVDVNNIDYFDFAGVLHQAPTVVTVTINFNENLSADLDSVFYMYYTNGEGAQAGSLNFGESDAVQVVQDDLSTKVGADVSNNIPNNGTYSFNYAYTQDTTNGRDGTSDVGVTIVCLGLERGQYVRTNGLSIGSTATTLSVVAPLERNYDDPAN